MKGWRTLGFGLALALIGALAEWLESPAVTQFVADNYPWLSIGIGAIVAYLRKITTTPMLQKE